MNGEAASVMGPAPRLVLAMAQYRRGRKDQARKTLAAAVVSYDWSAEKADDLDAWIAHILRREAEALILPGLPAFLEGKYQPKDNDERLALLGVCQFQDRRAATAGLYAAAFAADPKLAEDLAAGHRFNAARAAAVAGCGGRGGRRPRSASRSGRAGGSRPAPGCGWTSPPGRNGWRPPTGRIAPKCRRCWALSREEPELAGLRDAGAQERLPAGRTAECRARWQEVAGLLRRAETPR